MQEGKAVGVLVGFEGGFMHQAANGEMCHQQPEHFLADQIGGLAAQHDFGAAQMGLEFVERGFDFPALVIERGQFGGRSLLVIQNGGDEPVQRLGAGDARKRAVSPPRKYRH